MATQAAPKAELFSAMITALVAVPLVYFFGSAAWDGQVRASEAPARALFGDKVFEQLKAGEKAEMHYMGRNRSAPDFTLKDKDGNDWTLSKHRGKTLILNFWSITCQPCVEEMPSLLELARIAKHRGDLEVVAVSTDKNWQTVSTIFPEQHDLTVLFDPDKSVVKGKYGTKLFPETWIIDPDGVIRYRYDGPRDWSSPLTLSLID